MIHLCCDHHNIWLCERQSGRSRRKVGWISAADGGAGSVFVAGLLFFHPSQMGCMWVWHGGGSVEALVCLSRGLCKWVIKERATALIFFLKDEHVIGVLVFFGTWNLQVNKVGAKFRLCWSSAAFTTNTLMPCCLINKLQLTAVSDKADCVYSFAKSIFILLPKTCAKHGKSMVCIQHEICHPCFFIKENQHGNRGMSHVPFYQFDPVTDTASPLYHNHLLNWVLLHPLIHSKLTLAPGTHLCLSLHGQKY